MEFIPRNVCRQVSLGDRELGEGRPVYFIAEIGINHNGSLEVARQLIDAAVRVTSLGEGGISTERAIPVEARQTHATQIGALDPIRTPESFRAGIDMNTID